MEGAVPTSRGLPGEGGGSRAWTWLWLSAALGAGGRPTGGSARTVTPAGPLGRLPRPAEGWLC